MSGGNGNGHRKGAAMRRPSIGTQQLMRGAAKAAIVHDKLGYRDARLLFEGVMVDVAAGISKRGKTGAAEALGVSRRQVQKVHARVREALR